MEATATNTSFNTSEYVAQLWDDRIRLCRYTPPKSEYKQLNDSYKVHLETGQVLEYTYADSLKAGKNFEACIRRSRRTIKEISNRNKFDYFLTITFNPAFVNRRSRASVAQAFKNVIKRLKYCFGGLAYLNVPEYHRDESGIHYHLMVNFARPPRLTYKGRTPKGQRYYTFSKLERFKREDCFLTVEKLVRNNPGYLIKYMTKENAQPLPRRFSTSRGLKRPALLDKVPFTGYSYLTAKAQAVREGFSVRCDNDRTTVHELKAEDTATEAAALARPDLFNIGTKDEKLKEIFYDFVSGVTRTVTCIKKIIGFGRKRYTKPIPFEKLFLEQLAFPLD